MSRRDLDLDLALARDLDLDLARAIAGDLAHGLAGDLILARAIAGDLALAKARSVVRHLVHVRVRGGRLDRVIVGDLALARARRLSRGLTRGLVGDVTLARGLAGDLALARDLARARGLARDLAGDLSLDLGLAGGLADVFASTAPPVRALVQGLEIRCTRTRELVSLFEGEMVTSVVPGRTPGRPCVLARQMIGQAVRLVPAAHRPRYDREFRSELAEVTQAGGWRAQIGYAVRLLSSMLVLRAVLTGAQPEIPERAGPG